MRHRVKDKLTNVLAPLLNITTPTKYHYWFALLLDPRYVMEIKDIRNFYQSENVDTKKIVQRMMPKLYYYIMAAELSVNPKTTHILVENNQESLYSHNNPNPRHSISAEAILLEMIDGRFQDEVINVVTGLVLYVCVLHITFF